MKHMYISRMLMCIVAIGMMARFANSAVLMSVNDYPPTFSLGNLIGQNDWANHDDTSNNLVQVVDISVPFGIWISGQAVPFRNLILAHQLKTLTSRLASLWPPEIYCVPDYVSASHTKLRYCYGFFHLSILCNNYVCNLIPAMHGAINTKSDEAIDVQRRLK